jgi:hypothetical protein
VFGNTLLSGGAPFVVFVNVVPGRFMPSAFGPAQATCDLFPANLEYIAEPKTITNVFPNCVQSGP